jgi:hypothetical protein
MHSLLFTNLPQSTCSEVGFIPKNTMCECTGNTLLARFIICMFVCLLFVISNTSYAAIVGDIIDSDAEVRYQLNGETVSKTDGALFVLQSAGQASGGLGTPSAIDIWAPYDANNSAALTGSKTFNTEVSQCQGAAVNNGSITNAATQYANGASIPLPAALSAFSSTSFKSGNPLIIRVVDLDQNLNPTIRDQVSVTLKAEGQSSDNEVVVLTETDNDSGEFIGLIQT